MDDKEVELLDVLDELALYKERFKQAQLDYLLINGQKLQSQFSLTLTISAIINRAISLINAFYSLSVENNYLAAASLIRLQLDNVLSFYALNLVDSPNDLCSHILKGLDIKDYKSKDDHKLSNNFIVKQLESIIPNVRVFYKDMCSFIHLSNKFVKAGTKTHNVDGKLVFGTSVGEYDFFNIDQKIKCSDEMMRVTAFLLHLFKNNIVLKKNN